MKRDQIDLAKGWFLKAEQDIKNIEIILDADNIDAPYDTLCFHAQQASEKYLKGFLAFHSLPIPRTHDIEELLQLCSQINNDFSGIIAESVILSQYAVATRYDFEFWPDRTEVENSLRIALIIKKAVLEKLPKRVYPNNLFPS